jgi:membrane protein DedA with SNARE-associated domain
MIAATTSPHLPGVLHSLEPTLNETVLILAAVYAGAGRLNVFLVGLLGFCGAVLGDNIGFAIGHFGGRPLIERHGRYIFLTRERIQRATGFFQRHGGWIIRVARFIALGVLLLAYIARRVAKVRGARASRAASRPPDHQGT